MPAVLALVQMFTSMGAAQQASDAKLMSESQARRVLERVRSDYGKIDVPTLTQLMGEELGPTEQSKIQVDPGQARAQQNALSKLEELGQGGLTLQDDATLNAAMGKVNRQVGAQQNSLRENMAARGTLGSGAELAMGMQNAQAGANRANEAGMKAAADAQSRAYDAILAGGQLAGQQRTQAYNEKSRAAQAQDLINHYNATRGPDAAKAQFGMNLQKTAGMNGQNSSVAGSYRNDGNTNAAQAGATGTLVNQGLGAVANYANQAPTEAGTAENPSSTFEDDYLTRVRNQGP